MSDLVTAPKRRWSFSLRTLFVVVTLFCCIVGWVSYQLNWIRERENRLSEWRAMGGEIVAGPAPWPIRILGASGVDQFQYGFVGGFSTRLQMLAVSEDVRDEIGHLFPESKIEMVSRW
jgi:hypothetical protein